MSSTTYPTSAATAPDSRRGLSVAWPTTLQLAILAAAAFAFMTTLFAPQLLWDGDTLWHVRTGEWMWAHHQVLQVDPFSFTVPGRRWVNLEWLSDLLMAPVYDAGGWSAIDVLCAVCMGALTWILASQMSRKLPAFSWAAAIFMALCCTTQSWLARPHLLALPLLALWTVQLMRARESHKAPPLWLVPVMTLWANLHGSYLLGLALIGPFALEALVEPGADKLKTIRDWGLFGVLSLIASVITPHGVDGLIYTVRLITMTSNTDIVEWQPTNFGHWGPFEVTLLAALFVLLYRGVKVPIIRLMVLLGLFHLTLLETRQQMVLAVVGVLLLAEPISQTLAGADPVVRLPTLSAAWRAGALAAILAVACLGAAIRMAIPAHLTQGPTAPITALDHVPASLRQQHVLNEYGFGGYLIFNHVRPFIDGRADMYGDDFIHPYMKVKKRDLPELKAMLARYGVRWTIWAADDPVVTDMDALPGWKRLYADKTAVVHVKVGA
ncbi:MAG TPA: hypothetical protein VHX64_06610 [Caulobacteraceae bacterium]|nr:hypothetical protein [Caulobacteraceae bacterium]